MKRLYLLRHAKSSWDDPGLSDHDRPLAPRGRKAAARMAAYIKEQGYAPGLVRCSSATRARQTLDLIAAAIPSDTTIEIEPDIYHAGAEELVTLLKGSPTDTESVMLIGHNPALQELVLKLAAGGPRLGSTSRKLPTAALAVLDLPVDDWGEIGGGEATLEDFRTPKELGS